MTLLSAGLALLAALAFAGMFVLTSQVVRTTTTAFVLWFTLTVNMVLLWIMTLAVRGWPIDNLWDWRYFMLAGLFAPLLGRLFQFSGMQRLGSNITTPITLTHPVITVVIAIVFLGEALSWLGAASVLLIVACSIAIGSGARASEILDSLTTAPRPTLILPVVASFCYGISMVFRKLGIDIVHDPYAAAAVTVTTSWTLSTLYMLASRSFSWRATNRRDVRLLCYAGAMSSVAPVLIYIALQTGDLVTVAPIASTTPMFALFLSYLFLRNQEIFTPRVVWGTFGTVIGLAVLTLSRSI